MRIVIETHLDCVEAIAIASSPDGAERVSGRGATLTEAIVNLVRRFGELRDLALDEMRCRGFVGAPPGFIGAAPDKEGQAS